MKKIFSFSRLFALMTLLFVGLGSTWADVATFDFTTDDGYAAMNLNNGKKVTSSTSLTKSTACITVGDISIVVAGSGNAPALTKDAYFRLYKNTNITFSVSGTKKITSITGTFNAYRALTMPTNQGGQYSDDSSKKTFSWSGSESSVTLNNATSGAADFEKWIVTYSEPGGPTLTSIVVSGTPTKTTYYAGEVFDPAGLTVTGTYSNNSQKAITSGINWTITPSTGLTAGTTSVSVVAKVGSVSSASYTVNGLTVNAIPEKTIAQFIAAEGGKCYLTGIVSNIVNTKYGNFDLTDESGTIYVYGCLTTEGDAQQFASLGVVAGDKIKVLADEYMVFNEKAEAVNVIFIEEIEIEKAKSVVTIVTPEGGTLVVKDGETVISTGDEVEEGTTLTIECTPADGYKFRNWQYKAGDAAWTARSADFTYTMTDAATTSFRANFDEIVYRTITWSVNGNTETIAPSQVEDGKNITFPTELDDIFGKKFVGWSANYDANKASDLISGNVAASESTSIFYAVYADVTPGTEETATLTITDTETCSYTNGLTRTDDNGNNWVSYACINSQSVNGVFKYYIQINKSSNGYYIGSPDFGANIIAISAMAWNTNSSNRSAYLRANTETKQPSTSDYGTTTIPGNSKGAKVDFTINDDAEFSQFYIYSSASIGFESIEVTYGTPDVYSNYTTTIATSADITISAAGYATYFNAEHAFVMPDDCEGYVFTAANGLVLAYEAETVVPAGEPLVIYTIEPGKKTLVFTTSAEPPYADNDKNDLQGAATAMTAAEMETANPDAVKFYALSLNAAGEVSSVGFYWVEENGAAFDITAGKAYLALPATSDAPARFLFNETTALENKALNVEVKKVVVNGQMMILRGGNMFDLNGRIVK